MAIFLLGTSACTSGSTSWSPGDAAMATEVTTTTLAQTTDPACGADQLSIGVEGTSSEGTTQESTVAFENVSNAACSLSGYPSLSVTDDLGAPLSNPTVDGGSYGFTNFPVASVTLVKGADALANIGTDDPSTSGCQAATIDGITAPNTSSSQQVMIDVAMCDGTMTVSPVFDPSGQEGATAVPPSAPASGSPAPNGSPVTTAPGDETSPGPQIPTPTAPTVPIPAIPAPTVPTPTVPVPQA